jgi:hypothetical protein
LPGRCIRPRSISRAPRVRRIQARYFLGRAESASPRRAVT